MEKPINNSGKIAVHIRRGDFKKSNNSDFSYQIPTQWYIDIVDDYSLKLIQKLFYLVMVKYQISGQYLALEYGYPKINLHVPNMLSMSTADILVASSLLSLWSYFLSKQNTFFPKGLDLSSVISDLRNIEYA